MQTSLHAIAQRARRCPRKRFRRRLKGRLEKFGLRLSESKTRTIMFNRFRKEESKTFCFLGFEFRWVKTRRGYDTVRITTAPKRQRRIETEFSQCRPENANKRIAWIMGMVKTKLTGLRNYFGVVGNSGRIRELHEIFKLIPYRWLNRRSGRRGYNWKTFMRMWDWFNVSKLRRLDNEGLQLSFAHHLR